ncbi:MAG: carboxypeptidase regulatory-like domain-containing protein [Acidobacteriota bacterium]|nr:carboxypeptidase regulatory-like domain-containing protein [Acidobacteriota bacterium]
MSKRLITVLSGTALLSAFLFAAGCGGGSTESAKPEQPAAPATKAAAPASGPTLPMGSASINGTIRYEGAVPPMKPIKMDADPGCAMKHKEPVLSEMLILGSGNTVGNIIVSVKSGLPAGSWAVPSETVVIDQRGCQYVPHVAAMMMGQTVKFLNSDGVLHNVHALPKVNKQFNKAMPETVTETEHVFSKAEGTFEVKCDVHPWMKAYFAVLDHPFFAVTGTDGRFTISGLPAGTYEIEAWHERMGTQSATVTVGDGASQTTDFTFTPPKRG